MKSYYSVFNPRNQKIADCGSERDALNLMNMRNCKWDGHCYKFTPFDDNINDAANKELQPIYIEIGGQRIPIQQNLSKDCKEPFIPNFHD